MLSLRETGRQGIFELKRRQLQIWVGQTLSRDSPLYNMAFSFVFDEELRPDVFEQAWRTVVAQSDVLRTAVVERDGRAHAELLAPDACATRRPDLGDADGDGFRQWCEEQVRHPFTAGKALVDSALVALSGGRTGWYLNQHHLVTDARSTVLLYDLVGRHYAALCGLGAPPSALASFYRQADPLEGDDDWTGSEARRAASRHWRERQGESDRATPFYGRSVDARSTSSRRLTLSLGGARTRCLDAVAAGDGFRSFTQDVSRFVALSTLLSSWLYRVSGKSELAFESPIAGRSSPAARSSLGLFIDMLPQTVDLEPDDTFRSLAHRCSREAHLFLKHALPGAAALCPRPAGNVVLNYVPECFGQFAGRDAEVEWLHPGHADREHALRLQVHDFSGSGGLVLHFRLQRGGRSDCPRTSRGQTLRAAPGRPPRRSGSSRRRGVAADGRRSRRAGGAGR